MESLFERIERGVIWQSPGGIHPPGHKNASSSLPIGRLPMPDKLVLPVKQHIGAQGTLLVNPGDKVLKGQPLTEPKANWSLPVHAPTSGRVTAITPMASAHPSALPELSVIIEPDGEDIWCDLEKTDTLDSLSRETIVDKIHAAGIAGMGGAGFPAYVKADTRQEIEYLIVNGVECEPYITADDVLMQAHGKEIIQGIRVMQRVLGPKLVIIGIEDDKPLAIEAMRLASADEPAIQVRAIPTKYPSGGEKQLIQILTSKEVPSGGIPADIGVVVQNVGTLHAISEAVFNGKPLIERVVTVTGETIARPANVWALLGTEIKHLLDTQGFTPEPMQRVIMGGPMMGFTLPSVRIPVVKTTNCILAPDNKELPFPGDEKACIRCSACADACPASLLPQQLQWFAKTKEYNKLEEHNLFDCIECGACAYVCPSEIPLVQYYRVAKAEIREQQMEQIKAERARERFEARKERLEREQEERQKRHSRKPPATSDASKGKVADAVSRVKAKSQDKSAVAAAIARAKAKKQGEEPDNSEIAKLRAERKAKAQRYKEQKQAEQEQSPIPSDEKGDDKKAAVAAAIARAKAKKAAQDTQPEPEPASQDESASGEDKRKAAVAAAIARAKAKKASQQDEPDAVLSEGNESAKPQSSSDDKKAAVAAAIARAKAKKAAQNTQELGTKEQDAQEPNQEKQSTAEQPSAEDKKKAAVAAAIARAKAKKAAQNTQEQDAQKQDTAAGQQADSNTPEQTDASPNQQPSPEDKKKAAVAAAIARAKAKKAAQAKSEDDNK